ncbi:hypothetical protein [Paenibacillus sp. OV219]|uniref:hypothetical protein n=1 Tax=Paenibacillus sp. OV219 TaxID=1884377 RepID=UPI0015A58627|nr:hypothetical protein [Paenibacillus sp. OV219]
MKQQVDSKAKIKTYPKDVLFARGEQREFKHDAKEAAFLLRYWYWQYFARGTRRA